MAGVVLKATAGFYYVKLDNELWECSLRGKFRLDKTEVLVGDRVSIIPRHGRVAVIDKVHPRSNALLRPPVANVDLAVIIFAVREPEMAVTLLDRLLVQADYARVEPVICLNKIDLSDGSHREMMAIYHKAGYTVLETSTYNGIGIGELRAVLKDKISVLAGPSGVGKSSLFNAVQPGFSLKTGEVGKKIKRGRHTTRHVELLPLDEGGLVADTPGFSQLYLPEIKREELYLYFPEMEHYIGECRFSGCLHASEPDCAVKKAVDKNIISPARYGNYLQFLEEIIKQERTYR
jgi:ribosome biogenesis GTPase